jgi:hypothetical protein
VSAVVWATAVIGNKATTKIAQAVRQICALVVLSTVIIVFMALLILSR